jgi:hypothetical protein
VAVSQRCCRYDCLRLWRRRSVPVVVVVAAVVFVARVGVLVGDVVTNFSAMVASYVVADNPFDSSPAAPAPATAALPLPVHVAAPVPAPRHGHSGTAAHNPPAHSDVEDNPFS